LLFPALLVLGLSTAAVLVPCRVEAALPAKALEVGVFTGYTFLSRDSELGIGKNLGDVPDSGPSVGFRIGFALHQLLGFEGETRFVFSNLVKSGAASRVLGLRGHVRLHLRRTGMLRPFVVAGAGVEALLMDREELSNNDSDLALHAGPGLHIELSETAGLRFDARYIRTSAREKVGTVLSTTHEYEVQFGGYVRLGSAPIDTDRDGVEDEDDRCPTVAEDKDNFEDTDGCPDLDNDKDGFDDVVDQCRNEAEVQNGLDDEDGCPDSDLDGDKVADDKDRCPNEIEDIDLFQDGDGCIDRDNDRDGILDVVDRCPGEPEDFDKFEDHDGCPDPDADDDGVVDGKDRCEGKKETMNGFEDGDGCPDTVPVKLVKAFSGTMQGIGFEVGKAVITQESYPVLDLAYDLMVEYKDIRIEISGHTDTTGEREKNLQLSQDRASSVRQYFIDKGVDEKRMVAVGHGPDQPVADNKTPVGRAKNRRIDFRLLKDTPPPAPGPVQPGQAVDLPGTPTPTQPLRTP